MLNQCNFIGNLGNDPEIRHAASGTVIANISVACKYKYKDEEHTEWVRGVAFGKLAEIIGKYVTKGSQVYICGKQRTRKWQDQSGNNRFSTEIVANEMQMTGGRSEATKGYDAPPTQSNSKFVPEPAPSSEADFDDDVPF